MRMTFPTEAQIKALGLVLGYMGSLAILCILALKDGDIESRKQIISALVDIAVASAVAVGALGIADRIVTILTTRSQAQITSTAITTAGADAAQKVLNGSSGGTTTPHV